MSDKSQENQMPTGSTPEAESPEEPKIELRVVRAPEPPPVSVVKKGRLSKKSDIMGVWKDMYFYLLSDGTMKGFKSQPASPSSTDDCNQFTVKCSHCESADEENRFIFIIEEYRWTEIVQRTLSAKSDTERQGWLDAIASLKSSLKSASSSNSEGCLSPFRNKSKLVSELPKFKRSYMDFNVVKILGMGRFGKAVMCRELRIKVAMNMKILRRTPQIPDDREDYTLTEAKLIPKTKNPFLISCIAYFTYEDLFCFVTEFVRGGDLGYHLRKDRPFSVERSRFYGAEITSALGFLHKKQIIFKDLKLENILLDHEGHIKLADYGHIKIDITYADNTRTICGPKNCLAPEILMDDVFGFAADWWSLGIVMFQMLAGHLPFYNEDINSLYQLITETEPVYPESLSLKARSLLKALLEKDPKERLGSQNPEFDYQEVAQHPFFANLNWLDLVNRRITPPFVPIFDSEKDTRYFDPEVTKLSVDLSPPRPLVRPSHPEF